MEVRDGFIIGIFNYCDRWCEVCAFTSRCRVFVDVAETEAALDPNLKALTEVPRPPEPPPPQWMEDLLEEAADAVLRARPNDKGRRSRPGLPLEHRAIEARALDYAERTHAWLRARNWFSIRDPADPRAVVCWFHIMIAAKVRRALHGLAEDTPHDREWPADHDGSAKVALIGIDRSHAGWLDIVERGDAGSLEIAPFVSELVWLGEALERVFPNARAFVRPAFDEPEEVMRLVARERRG